MTLNLKTPPMPEPAFKQVGVEQGTNRRVTINNFTEAQLAARDAQWLGLVGPVVEAGLRALALMKEERECIFECHVDPATQQVHHGDHIAIDALNAYDSAIEKMGAALRAITEDQE